MHPTTIRVGSMIVTGAASSTFADAEPPLYTHGSSGAIPAGGGMNAGDGGMLGKGTTDPFADGSLSCPAGGSTDWHVRLDHSGLTTHD